MDLAFVNFSEPRKSTIAQTFTFAATSGDRAANLSMFFGSVAGSISGFGSDRPNRIDITVAGVTTALANPLASNDSEEWDTFNFPVDIPAGATELTVQAFSINPLDPSNTSNPKPASLVWTAAALSVPPEPIGAIGDTVWLDLDGNGIQNDADLDCPLGGGIPGVPVELRTPVNDECVGGLVDSTTTGAAGEYLFTDLVLDKKCRVETPPPPAFTEKCDGKIQEFTVTWPEDQPAVTVTLGTGLTDSSICEGGAVLPGQEVTFFTDGSTNDVFVDISGAVNGESKFHLSCSDKDMDADTATNEAQPQSLPTLTSRKPR